MRKLFFCTTIGLLGIILLTSGNLKNLQELKTKYPHLKEYNEQTINRLGYQLMQAAKPGEAIAVFKLNARLYPLSWNVYDSLGEAYLNTNQKKPAIKNFRRSLALNPGNKNALRILGRLQNPHLVPFTGEYEFYHSDRYQAVQIHIEQGKLVVIRPGDEPVIFTPLAPGESTFRGNEPKNPSLLSFARGNDGKVTLLKWNRGEEILSIPRRVRFQVKERYPVDQLRKDFLQFQRHLTGTFPHPYEFISKKAFDQLFTNAYQKISRPLNLREFYSLLVPLKAKIGCGHTHLDYPPEYRQNFKFPLILKFIGSRCYLVKTLNSPAPIPLYSEILAINENRIHRIIRSLKGDISADGYNDHFKTAALANCFQYYYANRYGTPEKFLIQYRAPGGGKTQSATIPAISCRWINYSNKKYGKLDFSILSGGKTAVLSVTSFIYYGKRNKIFFSFIDDSFKKLRENGIRNLIIDLRGNDGGDPFCAAYLLSHIEQKPVPYFSRPYGKYARLAGPVKRADNAFSGPLYFLIDGSGFSTNGHFCALLKYHRLGTFIGTETGGTYTCNGAVRRIHLKHTRILLKLTRKSFAAAVSGLPKNRGIIPDYTVGTGIRDLMTNRDPVMEFTLKIIARRKKTAGTEQHSVPVILSFFSSPCPMPPGG